MWPSCQLVLHEIRRPNIWYIYIYNYFIFLMNYVYLVYSCFLFLYFYHEVYFIQLSE